MSAPLPRCRLPDRSPRSVRRRFPPHATDAHMHVFGDPGRYPLAATRLFDPPAVSWQDYVSLIDALGIDRAVLVHSAVFGEDNGITADAIATAPDRFRGIALLSERTGDRELERLALAGFRGFRVNLVSGRGLQLASARQLAERVRPLGWHMQILMNVEDMPELDEVFAAFPVEVVVDHMGRPDPERGISSPGFQALIRLLQKRKGWSKISAPYRTSREPPPYADLKPFAAALAAAAPDRLVWGTDWPHVRVQGEMPNDGDLCNLLEDWIPQEEIRTKILVDNPARLYGFAP